MNAVLGLKKRVLFTARSYSLLLAIFFFSLISRELQAQPSIASFSPGTGQPGTQVVITGSNFQPDTSGLTVYFGPVKAAILASTANSITAIVPAGAGFHPISVTAKGLTTNSSFPFIPVFPGAGAAFVQTSFAAKIDLSPGNYPHSVGIQDIDGDGKPDLATAVEPGTFQQGYVSVSRNVSGPALSFADKQSISFGEGPDKICFSDLDGNSKQDMIVKNISNRGTLLSYKNTSVPGKVSFVSQPTGQRELIDEHYDMVLTDMDLDGKPDLILGGSYSQGFSVYRNVSNRDTIDFDPRVRYLLPQVTGSDVNAICSGDLNADGKPEIVVTRFNERTVYIIQNNSTPGHIAFGRLTTLTLPYNGGAICIQDLNNDGKPDLAVANSSSSSSTGQVSIYRNQRVNDSISMVLATTAALDGRPGALAIADLDGDSLPDLAATNLDANLVALFKNKGGGSPDFEPRVEFATGSSPQNMSVEDLDGDGKPEIIVSNYVSGTISVLRNQIGEALVVPNGSNPVTGSMVKRVIIDPTVQTYQGSPYVQRHYDIEPQNNPASSSGKVTLFFSQQEFDNLNAFAGHGLDLPTNPDDAPGKAGLRVFQYHGTSNTATPGSYNGSTIMINPDDTAIVWNPVAKWWEVSFEVTGFSGFFVSSASNTALPLHLLDFTAALAANKVFLQWHADDQTGLQYYQPERSDDGRNFVAITTLTADNRGSGAAYTAVDTLSNTLLRYYRLKMVSKDGNISYSSVVSIQQTLATRRFQVFPNPSASSCTVSHPAISASGAVFQLVDGTGRVVKSIQAIRSTTQTTINLMGVPPGIYHLVCTDGTTRVSLNLLVK